MYISPNAAPQTDTGSQTLAVLSPQAPSAAAAAVIPRGCSGQGSAAEES